MKAIIRTDVPFRYVQSLLQDDGTVADTGGMTLDEYVADRGFPCRVVEDDELARLVAGREANMITKPEHETLEQFYEALECMLPERWHNALGVELFHICERITGNLVNWHAKIGDRCFTFVDRDSADSNELAGAVATAARNAELYNCCQNFDAPEWAQFDALEIGGCIHIEEENGQTYTEGGKTRDEAEFFTVYGHLKEGGVEAITDAETFDAAHNRAQEHSTLSGLSVAVTC